MMLVHGTCIEIAGHGVLLIGPPGVGKSDLALRLIEEGARLVSDDQTEIEETEGALYASAPESILGLFEVRGLGVLPLEHIPETRLRLVIELVNPTTVERMPDAEVWEAFDITVPLIRLAPFEASATAKVRLAVRLATGDIDLAP